MSEATLSPSVEDIETALALVIDRLDYFLDDITPGDVRFVMDRDFYDSLETLEEIGKLLRAGRWLLSLRNSLI